MQAFAIALAAVFASAPAYSQQFGSAENLAPYIPTPQSIVEKMLEAAHVKPGEMVYDLGSGDGRAQRLESRRREARGGARADL